MITREKIKLPVDVPVLVALETVNGQECKSSFNGVEYRYNAICDSRPGLMYLTAQGRDALASLRPSPGDLIEIVKQKRGKEYFFSVQIVSDAEEPPVDKLLVPSRRNEPPPPPEPPAETRRVRMIAPAPAVRAAYAQANGGGYVNGSAAPQTVPQSHPTEELLARLFVAAGHALAKAHAQLKAEGFQLEAPIWEDVRAVGLSLFIQNSRKEGQR